MRLKTTGYVCVEKRGLTGRLVLESGAFRDCTRQLILLDRNQNLATPKQGRHGGWVIPCELR